MANNEADYVEDHSLQEIPWTQLIDLIRSRKKMAPEDEELPLIINTRNVNIQRKKKPTDPISDEVEVSGM